MWQQQQVIYLLNLLHLVQIGLLVHSYSKSTLRNLRQMMITLLFMAKMSVFLTPSPVASKNYEALLGIIISVIVQLSLVLLQFISHIWKRASIELSVGAMLVLNLIIILGHRVGDESLFDICIYVSVIALSSVL